MLGLTILLMVMSPFFLIWGFTIDSLPGASAPCPPPGWGVDEYYNHKEKQRSLLFWLSGACALGAIVMIIIMSW